MKNGEHLSLEQVRAFLEGNEEVGFEARAPITRLDLFEAFEDEPDHPPEHTRLCCSRGIRATIVQRVSRIEFSLRNADTRT